MTTRADDLIAVLNNLGVEVNRLTGDEIKARCPVHVRHKGRESDGYTWYMNADSGLWHCFTCHARGNLYGLLSELSADPGTLWNAQKYLIDTGLRRLTSEEEEDVRPEPKVDWGVYQQFPYLPTAVLNVRKLDEDVAKRYGIRWNPDGKQYVTPIVGPLGELRGWQTKHDREFKNVPWGVNKSLTLFGIERATASTALLVESPLDVVRFHSVVDSTDVNCVSSFGASVSDEQIKLLYRTFDKLILAFDNDYAGRSETKRLIPLLPSMRGGRTKYWVYDKDDPKDIGEMTDGQIVKGLERASSVYR